MQPVVFSIDPGLIVEVIILVAGVAAGYGFLRQSVAEGNRRIEETERKLERIETFGQVLTQLGTRMEGLERDRQSHGEHDTQLAAVASAQAVLTARIAGMDGALMEMRNNQAEMRNYFTTKFDQLFNDVHRIANVVSALSGGALNHPDSEGSQLLAKLRALVGT